MPTHRPGLIAKAVLDAAVQAGALADDRQIVNLGCYLHPEPRKDTL